MKGTIGQIPILGGVPYFLAEVVQKGIWSEVEARTRIKNIKRIEDYAQAYKDAYGEDLDLTSIYEHGAVQISPDGKYYITKPPYISDTPISGIGYKLPKPIGFGMDIGKMLKSIMPFLLIILIIGAVMRKI
jgi:hypothetical protein